MIWCLNVYWCLVQLALQILRVHFVLSDSVCFSDFISHVSPQADKKNKSDSMCVWVLLLYRFASWLGIIRQVPYRLWPGLCSQRAPTVQCYGSAILTSWFMICCDPWIHSNYFQVKSSHTLTINPCPSSDWHESWPFSGYSPHDLQYRLL